VVLVLAAPYVGVIRSEIRRAFPAQFSLIINAAVGVALVAAVAAGLARVTARRLPRYAAMAAAIVVAGAYSAATSSPDPAVRAVEHFHFVEYGVITFLFYRVWRDAGDWSAAALPFIAAFIVGAADEAFQWFLPARVGELKDVALNVVSIGCGLLFAVGAAPPPAFRFGWAARSARLTRRALAVCVLVLAAFVHLVHLGVVIPDPAAGAFTSRFTADELAALGRERLVAWQREPPLVRPARMSREDQYMTEGLQHVQARNRAWEAGEAFTAWRENLILERYFAPVLDTPSYVAPQGHRWNPTHRADAEGRARGTETRPFTSAAYPYPILAWPPWLLWLGAVALAAGLAFV
jgi:VanZ family protein